MIIAGETRLSPSEIVSELEKLPPDRRREIERYIVATAIQMLVDSGRYSEAIALALRAQSRGLLPKEMLEKLRYIELLKELKNWLEDANQYLSRVSGKKVSLSTIAEMARDAQHLRNVADMIENIASEIPWGENKDQIIASLTKIANELRDLATWSEIARNVLEASRKWINTIQSEVTNLLRRLSTPVSSVEDLDRATSLALAISSELSRVIERDLARAENEMSTIIETGVWRTELGKAIHDALKDFVNRFAKEVRDRLTRVAQIVSDYANALLNLDYAYTALQNFIHHLSMYGKEQYVLGNSGYVDMLRRDLHQFADSVNKAIELATKLSREGAASIAQAITNVVNSLRKTLLDVATQAINIDPRFYDYLSQDLAKCGVYVASPYRAAPLKEWYEIIEKVMRSLSDQARLAFLAGLRNLNKVWGAPLLAIGALAEIGTGMINTLLTAVSPLHLWELIKGLIDLGRRTVNATITSGLSGVANELRKVAEAMFGTPERALQTVGMMLVLWSLPKVLERFSINARLAEAISSVLAGDPFTPVAMAILESSGDIARVLRATILANPSKLEEAIRVIAHESPVEITERAIREALLRQGIKLSRELEARLARDVLRLSKVARNLRELEKILSSEATKSLLENLAKSLKRVEESVPQIASEIRGIEASLRELAARLSKIYEEIEKVGAPTKRIKMELRSIERALANLRTELSAVVEAEKALSGEIERLASIVGKEVAEAVRADVSKAINALIRAGIPIDRLKRVIDILRRDLPEAIKERSLVESRILTDITRIASELERSGIDVSRVMELAKEGRFAEALALVERLVSEAKIRPSVIDRLLSDVKGALEDLERIERRIETLRKSIEGEISSVVKAFGARAEESIRAIQEALRKALPSGLVTNVLSRLRVIERTIVSGRKALEAVSATIGKDIEELIARFGKKLAERGVNIERLRRIARELVEGKRLVSEDLLESVVSELSKASSELATVYGSRLLAEIAAISRRIFGEASPITREIEELLKRVRIVRRIKVELAKPASEVRTAVSEYLKTLSGFEPELAERIKPLLDKALNIIERIERGETATKQEVREALTALDNARELLSYALVPSKAKRAIVSLIDRVIASVRSLLGKVPKESVLYSVANDMAQILEKLRRDIEVSKEIPSNYVVITKVGGIERGTIVAVPKHLETLVQRLIRGGEEYTINIHGFRLRVYRRMVVRPDGGVDMYWVIKLPNGMYFGIKIGSKVLRAGRRGASVYREVTVFYDPRLPRYARTNPAIAKLIKDLSRESVLRLIEDIDPSARELSKLIVFSRGIEVPLARILSALSYIPVSATIAQLLSEISGAKPLHVAIPSLSPKLIEALVSTAQAIELPKTALRKLAEEGIVVLGAFKVPSIPVPIVLAASVPPTVLRNVVEYTTVSIGGVTLKIPIVSIGGVKFGLALSSVSIKALPEIEASIENILKQTVTPTTPSVTPKAPQVSPKPTPIPTTVTVAPTTAPLPTPEGVTLSLPGSAGIGLPNVGFAAGGVQREVLELV